ncbi:hypothetical protein SAMN05444354_103373 [Stigmatella aurantiaca]|uniref:Uncharacterized protein n=1 Tax=Stigmatella aurantiaca TaxID=41 RepID=A0A1H7LY25_STIAU|nr:hypothetical protein [Stigmatella aurantiaca]SEL03834.1 hypothetical protein SAMN05444354_103373 [Stigmatella aurantiaca]
MPKGPSPLVRAGLLLFSVAVVGALIGFAWEARLSEQEEARLDTLMSRGAEGLPGVSPRSEGPTPEEQAVVRRATQGMPPYKDAIPQPLAADFLDENSPIAVAWFMTPDAPSAVLDFYQAALMDAGLPPVQRRYNANAGYIGYWMPDTQQMHTVSVLAQGEETMVLVSAGKVESFIANHGKVPPGVPLPPGARDPMVLSFREEGQVRHSIVTELGQEQVEGLRAFYQQTLEPQGWSMDDSGPAGPEDDSFSFRRGSSRLSAMVQREGARARFHLTLEQPE